MIEVITGFITVLFYVPIVHILKALPTFLLLIVPALSLLSVSTGVGMFIISFKRKASFFIPLATFIGSMFFVTLAQIVGNVYDLSYLQLQLYFAVFFLIGLIGLVVHREETVLFLHSCFNVKQRWFVIAFLFLSTIFLTNLIKENGLHDEYFHHAVIKIFLKEKEIPFLEPYQIGQHITSYHVGIYYPVIALQALFQLSVENSLDAAKFYFYLATLPLIFIAVSRLLTLKSWLLALAVIAIFFSGSSLFLIDTFTQNVFTGSNLEQLRAPIFLELAGLSWYAVLYYFIALLLFAFPGKNLLNLDVRYRFFFNLVTTYFLFLINKGFFLAYVFSLCLYYSLELFSSRKKELLRKRYFLLGVIFIAGLLLELGKIANFATVGTHQITSLFRANTDWGIPFYSNIDGVAHFSSITDGWFLRQVGITWLWSFFLLITARKKISLAVFWFLLSQTFFFYLIVYFMKFGDFQSTTALTRLARIGFMFEVIILFWLGIQKAQQHWIKVMTYLIIAFSLVSPLYYFATANVEDRDRPWVINDLETQQLVDFLQTKQIEVGLTTDSAEVRNVLANTLSVQVQQCQFVCLVDSDYFVTSIKNQTISQEPIFMNAQYKVYAR